MDFKKGKGWSVNGVFLPSFWNKTDEIHRFSQNSFESEDVTEKSLAKDIALKDPKSQSKSQEENSNQVTDIAQTVSSTSTRKRKREAKEGNNMTRKVNKLSK